MKKRGILSVLIIVLAVAAVGGATMAWFTDQSEPIANSFTAGTLILDVREFFNEAEVLNEENVNPGDCFLKRFEIYNSGTKHMLVRMNLTEKWLFDVDYLEENWVNLGLGDDAGDVASIVATWTEPFDPADDDGYGELTDVLNNPVKWDDIEADLVAEGWLKHPTDGYWYYNGVLAPETQMALDFEFEVCFDGPGMGNAFQKVNYKLVVSFEAIQASNNASGDLWEVDSLYDPDTSKLAVDWDGWNF